MHVVWGKNVFGKQNCWTYKMKCLLTVSDTIKGFDQSMAIISEQNEMILAMLNLKAISH